MRFSWVWVGCLATTIIVLTWLFFKKPVPIYPIQGTFIQLLENSHGQWDEKEWLTFFGYLRKLKISNLYLQWTVADTRAFFSGSSLQSVQSVQSPPLETILKLAEQFDIKISIGLVYDAEYWNQITQNSHQVKIYLDDLLRRSIFAAEQITPIALKYQSFDGWYITEEVDDLNWNSLEKRELLFAYLEQLSNALEKLTLGYQIAISGFSNGRIEIAEFSKFWNQLFKRTKINLALFQDGIGAKKLTFSRLPDYLAAFKQSATDHQREIGVIVEIFRQTNGYPINTRPFQAVPADFSRINRQRQIASKFSQNLVAFSIPSYMMPIAGHAQELLYNEYLSSIEEKTNADSKLERLR